MPNLTLFTASYFLLIVLLLSALGYILPSVVYASNFLFCGVMGLTIAYYAFPYAKKAFFDRRVSPHNKAVLITGCGAGFGWQTAKQLDSLGFHVFASCRSLAGPGPEALKKSCSDRLHLLELDITKEESVKTAVAYVQQNLNGLELWALVNNAGVYKGCYIGFTSIEDLQDSMNVNAIGTVRVTKAFLPLLKKSEGRIVTVGSIAGRIPFAMLAAYSMSKYALVCFCECLRQEIYHLGVKVVIIEPEIFRSAMANSTRIKMVIEKCITQAGQSVIDCYEPKFVEDLEKQCEFIGRSISDKVNRVIDDIEAAVCLEEPAYVYRPYRNEFLCFLSYILENSPKPAFDIILRIINSYVSKITTIEK